MSWLRHRWFMWLNFTPHFWDHWEPRIYRTAPGFWGLAVNHSASRHWAVQVGPWVLTTEPE